MHERKVVVCNTTPLFSPVAFDPKSYASKRRKQTHDSLWHTTLWKTNSQPWLPCLRLVLLLD